MVGTLGLANFAVLGWLVGIARAGTALVLQIVINLVNMAATSCWCWSSTMALPAPPWPRCWRRRWAWCSGSASPGCWPAGASTSATGVLLRRDKLVHMLAINRDIMIRTVAIVTAFTFFTAQGARAGDVALAANAVLHNFILIGSFFLDGFATAAEQFCGRAVGAKDGSAFVAATRRISGLGLSCSAPRPRFSFSSSAGR